MTIENMLVDKNGYIPVWGKQSNNGSVYYTFKLTDDDEFIMFPNTSTNPKAPKFSIKKKEPLQPKEEE